MSANSSEKNNVNNIYSSSKNTATKIIFHEFFIDLMGGLIPGILLLVSVFLTIVPTIHSISGVLTAEARVPFFIFAQSLAEPIEKMSSAFWIAAFIGLILLTYVIGHIFYRKGPKKPDMESFDFKTKHESYNEINFKINLGCAKKEDCEFPYPDYDKYLEHRGMNHLVPFVIWRNEENKKDKEKRSKNVVNLLKIRLRYHFPEKCGMIIRNEAHVRLSSSTWFVSKFLMYFSGLCCAVNVILAFISPCYAPSIDLPFKPLTSYAESFAWHIPSIAISLIVLLLSLYAYRSILKYLHYARMREVFYVFETAYTAFREKAELLRPPFEDIYK